MSIGARFEEQWLLLDHRSQKALDEEEMPPLDLLSQMTTAGPWRKDTEERSQGACRGQEEACASVTMWHSPPSLGAASFTGPSNVDPGKRGGCYPLTRSELQGKSRVADKLSKWDLGTAPGTAHDLPLHHYPLFSG